MFWKHMQTRWHVLNLQALIDVKSQTRIQIHLFDWDRTGGDDPLGRYRSPFFYF